MEKPKIENIKSETKEKRFTISHKGEELILLNIDNQFFPYRQFLKMQMVMLFVFHGIL